MRILVLSNSAWNDNNSFGSSFSGIFGGLEGLEFANIYCRFGMPDNKIVSRYFQITEKSLIANLKDKTIPSGREITACEHAENFTEKERENFKKASRVRWQVLFWGRDLIWSLGRWKSKELTDFLDDFKPDLIFQPVYYSNYISNLALFIRDYTKAPSIGYVSDDVYTLKQLSFSPLYWIDRFVKRAKIRKVIGGLELLYVISELQKREYEKIFKKECRVLTKGLDFSGEPQQKTEYKKPLQLVYMGNIYGERQKTLLNFGRCLDENDGILQIYTPTPISKQMRKAFDSCKSIKLNAAVPPAVAEEIRKGADVLVFAEGYSLKSRLLVRMSLSTKAVEYLGASRPIVALGNGKTAAMEHFKRYNSAFVIDKQKETAQKTKSFLACPEEFSGYVQRAWECGRECHDIKKIQSELKNTLVNTAKKG